MKEDVCHEERKAALQGYIGFRRQVWENPNHHKRPEMVRATCREDGSKQFEVVSENGPRIFGNDRESLRRTTKAAKKYLARDRIRVDGDEYARVFGGRCPHLRRHRNDH